MLKLLAAPLALLVIAPVDARLPRGSVAFSMPSVVGLHVSGNHLLNGSGQVLQLRGVDLDGTEYMCLDGNLGDIFDPTSGAPDAKTAPGAALITVLRSWGINALRVPYNESCWGGINGASTGGTAYQTPIINFVNFLTSNGFVVIMDLQWVGPGSQLANLWCGGQFAPLPDADHAPATWTSVANAFKTNPLVMFDLYNEPLPNNNADDSTAWSLLSSGGAVTTSNSGCPSGYTAVGTQSLVNTIRATGATNIIEVPGTQFTNSLSAWVANEPTDTLSPAQITAGWHSYAGQGCQISCASTTIASVAASVPVVTEEIGENDCQGIYIDPLMAELDSIGVSYLAWAMNVYDCSSFPSLIADNSGTPTGFGIDFRNHLLTLAGLPIPPTPPETYFSTVYPFGLAVGSPSDITATDSTVYHQDPYVQSGSGTFTVAPGLQENMQYFQPYSTTNTISGTPDPTLYQHGRYGQFGTWIINVPNGNYTVTLGIAPATAYTQSTVNDATTSSINNAGEFGQDDTVQGNKDGTCIWSQFFNGTNSPYSTPPTSCPATGGGPVPTVNAAVTVSYTVGVFNGQLSIEPGASFGNNRKTIINTIKVAQSP